MGLIDRFIGKVADQVADRLRPAAPPPPPAAPPALVQAAFSLPPFPPGTPLTPQQPPGTAPREWQYPVGFNLNIVPRGTEPVGFDMLRNLADLCDLVRICIEMRKDQLCGREWSIIAKDEGDSGRYDDQIRTAQAFFERPDRETNWDGWLRMLLEDNLVLDAASIYRRRTRGGQLYALEIVDGSTIKPLLDGRGRTPQVPLPAYQQILYGFPSTSLTTDELLYRPKNRRARSAYGSSPVEWVLLAINWYLRRETFNVSYYTSGNVPEGIASAPEGWTPEQIRQLEDWFNAVTTGNMEELRKIRFLGHGFTFTKTRDINFEVDHEEWLARVITAAFEVNYQRFVQRVVRATAEVAASEQADIGEGPLRSWVSGLITEILATDLGMPFLKHQFTGGEQKDEAAEVTKNVQYVAAGIMARDEVRDSLGLDPADLPLTKDLTVTTPAGVVSLAAPAEPQPAAGSGQQAGEGQQAAGSGQQAGNEGEKAAAGSDLAKWRRKAVKAFREGNILRAVEFTSTAIAPGVHAEIAGRLAGAKDEADILKAFELARAQGRRGAGARGKPNRTKQQDPEVLRRIQEIVARRFRAQAPAVVARAHELHAGAER